jgi:metal-responsive CopG/Arc/MetJ family transcriptional regulator
MRATITLDDGLLERLKKRAAESGTSVSGLIERAVRPLLQASAPRRRDRFDLVDVRRGRAVHNIEYR